MGEIRILILQFSCKLKQPRITKQINQNQNKVGERNSPDVKTNSEVTLLRTDTFEKSKYKHLKHPNERTHQQRNQEQTVQNSKYISKQI